MLNVKKVLTKILTKLVRLDGYARLTVDSKQITSTSNTRVTGLTAQFANSILFSKGTDYVTVKVAGVYRVAVSWTCSATSNATSVRGVEAYNPDTNASIGWMAMGRDASWCGRQAEALVTIATNTKVAMRARDEGGNMTLRNARIEITPVFIGGGSA